MEEERRHPRARRSDNRARTERKVTTQLREVKGLGRCVCVCRRCVWGERRREKIFGETDVKRERARAGEGNVVECVEEGAGGRKQCVWS